MWAGTNVQNSSLMHTRNLTHSSLSAERQISVGIGKYAFNHGATSFHAERLALWICHRPTWKCGCLLDACLQTETASLLPHGAGAVVERSCLDPQPMRPLTWSYLLLSRNGRSCGDVVSFLSVFLHSMVEFHLPFNYCQWLGAPAHYASWHCFRINTAELMNCVQHVQMAVKHVFVHVADQRLHRIRRPAS